MMKDIVSLLCKEAPRFQLASGTEQLGSSEGFLARSPQRTDHLERRSHALSTAVLEWIAETVEPDWTTLETGGGWSTCVFAVKAAEHICVNPDVTANELVEAFLAKHRCRVRDLRFCGEPSDAALPRLSVGNSINLALIDGCHSFPLPIIDWYYVDQRMRAGGLIVLDDCHIRAVAVLKEFLELEPAYEFVRAIGHASVFRKVADEREVGWAGQPFNLAV